MRMEGILSKLLTLLARHSEVNDRVKKKKAATGSPWSVLKSHISLYIYNLAMHLSNEPNVCLITIFIIINDLSNLKIILRLA